MQAIFAAQEGGFDLVVNGQTYMRHRTDNPAIISACGVADVEMYRGNFQIMDTASSLPSFQYAEVELNSVKLRSVSDGPCELTINIEQNVAGFALRIESHDPACNRLSIDLVAGKSEYIWGGGEQMSHLQLNGRKFPIWTSEPGVGRDKSTELTRIMDKEGMAGGDYWTTNYPQPTFLSSNIYACHLDSSAYSVLNFTDPARHRIEVWENNAKLEFFFADGLQDLVGQLSTRFGRQPKLPQWAIEGAIIGLKQGDESFYRFDKIRAAGAKVSALWCEDWVGIRHTSFGRRLFWNWQWNGDRYPNLPAKLAKLRDEGIGLLGYVNPYLAIDGPQFAEAKSLGLLALQLDVDEPYLVDFGEFDCGIVDFTNEAACAWFADCVIGKEMLDFGLCGWMADFGEYLPVDLRLHDGSDPMLAHNRWPVLWAEVNARAIRDRNQTGEALFFMRAGFSGVQSYCPLLWAGDQCVDFSRHDGIGTVITAALSAGLVGNAYSHSDIGGYTSLHGVVRTPELLMRWTELAAFTPVMRTHEGNRPDENLQIDSTPEILNHFAAMTRVHHAMMPYVKSLCVEATEMGLPLLRPMFLHYPHDEGCQSCQDQYLYGPDLLVAPIIEESLMAREVLIPQDSEWVHIWTGEKFTAGVHNVAAPFGSPPVFVRVGSPFTELFMSLSGEALK